MAMVDTMRGIRVRLTMSKLMFLHRDPVWMENVKIVRDFVDERIDASLTQLQDVKSGKRTSCTENQPDGRTDLLWDMVQQLQDKEALRGQIMAVFIPSNDTTSILISNAIYALARHPHVYQTLREEVLALGDQEITFEKLRGLRYLRYVINESECMSANPLGRTPRLTSWQPIVCTRTASRWYGLLWKTLRCRSEEAQIKANPSSSKKETSSMPTGTSCTGTQTTGALMPRSSARSVGEMSGLCGSSSPLEEARASALRMCSSIRRHHTCSCALCSGFALWSPEMSGHTRPSCGLGRAICMG